MYDPAPPRSPATPAEPAQPRSRHPQPAQPRHGGRSLYRELPFLFAQPLATFSFKGLKCPNKVAPGTSAPERSCWGKAEKRNLPWHVWQTPRRAIRPESRSATSRSETCHGLPAPIAEAWFYRLRGTVEAETSAPHINPPNGLTP